MISAPYFHRLLGALGALLIPALALALEPPPGGGYPHQTTALGDEALFSLTQGVNNTALGFNALHSVTTSSGNTAIGANALQDDTGGQSCTATGDGALQHNTVGFGNTAHGAGALTTNTSGYANTAVGTGALQNNTTGYYGVAIGESALFANTTGAFDNAIGLGALENNTTGSGNCALGQAALNGNRTGYENIALGTGALSRVRGSSYNIAIGRDTLTNARVGSSNIAIGYQAGQGIGDGSNNIIIANDGTKTDSGVIRIGTSGDQTSAYLAGINDVTISGGVPVVVSSSGQLGVATSSARFKDHIQPMKDASAAVLSLKPVTFRYKENIDAAAIPQFGLVAEEVARVDPDLVVKGGDGKPFTVRYEAVNAMLLNEFLKEHSRVASQTELNTQQSVTIAQQEKEIGELKAAVAALQKTSQTQAVQLQKVSAQVEASHSQARLVATGR